MAADRISFGQKFAAPFPPITGLHLNYLRRLSQVSIPITWTPDGKAADIPVGSRPLEPPTDFIY
jgi:hypothetical protein